MPGLNQKGPVGQGPRTGRGRGRCANLDTSPNDPAVVPNENKNASTNMQGRGSSCGRGRGKNGQGAGLGRQNRSKGGL